HEIDTGDIIFSEKVAVGDTDTAGDLHDRLMEVGAALLVRTVKAIETGDYQETPQEQVIEAGLKHAPKIFKEDCAINFNQDVEKVFNHIRGLSPYPTAFTRFQDKNLKIFHAVAEKGEPGISPGGILSDQKTYLKFACRNGFISVTDLQLEGKKRMNVEEFLRGVRL
ncbi:MAG TPA: methionyl-tRNA formyltransferase, partial [Sphingobacteriaceae bacterium]